MKTAELKRLAICPCGFTVLKDTIQLGKKFVIDESTIRRDGFNYFCGGCNTWIKDIEVVDAEQSGRPEMAPLPYALFLDLESQN
jgi:hypothetical protein